MSDEQLLPDPPPDDERTPETAESVLDQLAQYLSDELARLTANYEYKMRLLDEYKKRGLG